MLKTTEITILLYAKIVINIVRIKNQYQFYKIQLEIFENF